MNKPPAFQFYAADFLVDAAVTLMSLEERGAYVTLLAHSWIEGPLPSALPKLARLCAVPTTDMERLWPAIEPCWEPSSREGFIINPRLEKERRKQAAFRKSQSDKAKDQQARLKQATAEPVPSSYSPSSSLTSESKTTSAAAPPEPSNPMAILGPLIREHLYRGEPPSGYESRRCASVVKALLRKGYSVDDLRDAILVVPRLRAGTIQADDSLRRWFAKQPGVTMLALNDRWGSGAVLDQLLHIARKAERPVVRGMGLV